MFNFQTKNMARKELFEMLIDETQNYKHYQNIIMDKLRDPIQ